MIPFVDISKEFELFKNEITSRLNKVLFNSDFILGEEVKNFEANVANLYNVQYASGVGSGTDAIKFALKAANIGEGDEVITTPFSFVATTGAILQTGATPVFADINPETFNIEPDKIEEAITDKTKAVVIVHLFGNPCSMDKIVKISKKRGLLLIEDCAHSFGSKYKNKFVGTFGNAGCFSFYPSKNLGAYGDGGMIITNSSEYYRKYKLMRNHGLNDKNEFVILGCNSRLDSIQAAILNVKIEYFNQFTEKRRKLAKLYVEKLSEIEEVIPQKVEEDSFHTYNILTLRVKTRDKLKEFLNKNGISCAVYYPTPIPEQPAMKFLKTEKEKYFIASNISKQVLSLPLYPALPEESVINIISKIKEFYGK
jgi:dTDP-4-amino-4,6-dideoxygalactose transaminase